MNTRFNASAVVAAPVRIAPLALAITLGALVPGTALADPSVAPTRHYELVAGSLGAALTDFARQAGVSVQFNATQIGALRAPALVGDFSVGAGFARLLEGSGLYAKDLGGGVYLIQPVSADSTMLRVLEVTAERSGQNPLLPAASIVAENSATASKTGTSILQNAQAVNVVTREEIEARGAGDVTQALQYTPGVVSQYGNTDMRHDWLSVRGFNPGRFMDGLRLPYGVLGYAQPRIDPYLLERVEVLKGPASVLYGQSLPGGLLNMISKRPGTGADNELRLQYGSHNHRELAFDLGGDVNEQGSVAYRVVGLGREADSQVDHVGEERTLLAPSLMWQVSDSTRLTLLAHYQKIDADGGGAPPALPALGTLYGGAGWGKLGPDTFIGEPGYDHFVNEQFLLGYELEHQLNDTWTLRQNLRLSDVDTDTRRVQGYMLSGNSLVRYAWAFPEQSRALTIDNQAMAAVQLGDAEHRLLLGLDYQREEGRYDEHFSGLSVSPIDLTTLQYTGDAIEPPLTTRRDQDRYQVGLYLQDEIQWHAWSVQLAGRYDVAKADNDVTDYLGGTRTSVKQDDEAFSGRAGLVYSFDNGLAPYVGYTRSFAPTAGTGDDGEALKPTEGEQYELGLRYQPVGSRSLFTLSAYRLTQQDVLTRDLVTNQRSQTGEVEIQGIELEGKMEVTQGMQAIASWAWTDSEITRDGNAAIEGNQQPFVPKRQGSLWLDYRLQDGLFRGLGMGAGARYLGASYGETANNYKSDAVTLFDAAVSYDLRALTGEPGVSLQLSANNLTDREYISTCISAMSCYWGEGRNVTASLSYRW